MPEEKLKPSEELIDVGETEGAEINLDEKGVPEKPEMLMAGPDWYLKRMKGWWRW